MSSRFSVDGALRRRILEKALLARFVDETLLELFAAGQLHGTVHTCIGQEMSGLISEFLRPTDTIFSNHRCHGHFLWRTGDAPGLIAELMGRQAGVCGGIGGSQHLYKGGFYSNGIQGGIAPVAAGLALAHKLRGSGNISVVYLGDGTLGEGVVYETFNLAAKWDLPLLLVLEDNKYAQSTAQHETLAGEICSRPAAFGIETIKANTWNWESLYAVAGALIEQLRQDSRPRFLYIETYRLKAHSKGDDTRSREIVEPFERRDPLNRFLGTLNDHEREWVDELRARVAQAVQSAQASPPAVLPELSVPGAGDPPQWRRAQLPGRRRGATALNECLRELMGEHPEIQLLGEDVLSPYGGAFKATKDLSDLFAGRVRNTPISEACIVGVGAGLGLMGYRPIVEIMFGDFVGLAFDQIVNHAAKFHQMYNQQVVSNLIIRTPMGGGRGYGPTHSQTLDRHFFGVPGLRVLAVNHLLDPARVYRPLLETSSGPTLVIENKRLYGSHLLAECPAGFQVDYSSETFPSVWIRPEAPRTDLTLLGYGGTSELLLEACELLFAEHDLIAQVLAVMQVYPFSIDPLLEALRCAPRLLIVEEGQGFAGFGAEVLAQIAEAPALRALQVRRLYPPAHCVPASGGLEKQMLPSVAAIAHAAVAMSGSR
ncbi:MAG: pyruvate dehydrogenase [Gammaproteobacteria bacterium]|nr:pyruvate dehydrogenase [Gammaproteobacteria bacterium]MBV8308450.1 pyruvate dehydrogenase [Gammaproteobacteria bacterium]MBV8403427.1 pyruvate dehydrogenase [Gammaproteobacteria bacterium]